MQNEFESLLVFVVSKLLLFSPKQQKTWLKFKTMFFRGSVSEMIQLPISRFLHRKLEKSKIFVSSQIGDGCFANLSSWMLHPVNMVGF